MYETPLGDCLAGMIMEPTVYKEMKESIDMDKDDAYFNSGVILMDLAGWRRENVLKKLLEFLRGSCRKPFLPVIRIPLTEH